MSADTPGRSLHASCVAVDGGAGVLITGASGAGKSALALQLIALGATLVADDLVPLRLEQGHPVAHAPPRLAGVIEARGVGLLRVTHQPAAPVRLVVDMDHEETERLPQTRVIALLGVHVPLIYRLEASHFPASVFIMARGGRYA